MRNELFRKIVNTMTEAITKDAVESGEIDEEKAQVSMEKFQLLTEQAILEDKLGNVTRNSYVGITKILNEHEKVVNESLAQTYEKCKKFLDDNNLPYEEKRKDTDDEEVQDEQGDVQ